MATTLQALIQNVAKDEGIGYASGAASVASAANVIVDTSTDSPFDALDPSTK